MSVYETMIISTDRFDRVEAVEFEVTSNAREFTTFIAHEFAEYSFAVNRGDLKCYTVLCFETVQD